MIKWIYSCKVDVLVAVERFEETLQLSASKTLVKRSAQTASGFVWSECSKEYLLK